MEAIEVTAVEGVNNNTQRNSTILQEYSISRFKSIFGCETLQPAYVDGKKGVKHMFLVSERGLVAASVSNAARAEFEAGNGLNIARILECQNNADGKISYVAAGVDDSRLERVAGIVL